MQSNPGLIWRMDRQNDRVMSLGFSLFMLKFSFSVEMDYFMREWWLEGCHYSRMVGYHLAFHSRPSFGVLCNIYDLSPALLFFCFNDMV